MLQKGYRPAKLLLTCSSLTQLLGQPRPGRLELLRPPLSVLQISDVLMFFCAVRLDRLRSTVLEGFGIASLPVLSLPTLARGPLSENEHCSWGTLTLLCVFSFLPIREYQIWAALSPPHPREHSLVFWCLFHKSPALLSISSARVPTNILYNSELRPSSQTFLQAPDFLFVQLWVYSAY